MKLLVVDDDVHIRRIVALYLRDHDVAEAGTAEEALARVGGETFDVVIVDVILPHFGGLRLCRKIKETATPPRVSRSTWQTCRMRSRPRWEATRLARFC